MLSNSLDLDQAWHFVRPDLGPNCLQTWKGIRRQHKSPLVGKKLNTKIIVDTTFRLKPWLKLISLALTFSIWLKYWSQQILSQSKPWVPQGSVLEHQVICLPVRRRLFPELFNTVGTYIHFRTVWACKKTSLAKAYNKMCVSGYPTLPNFLSPTLSFLSIFRGFPRDFPVQPYCFSIFPM